MKACNFASLDPAFRASGRRGLSGASEADRALWDEFTRNPELVAAESEDVYAELESTSGAVPAEIEAPSGDTEILRTRRERRVQSYFRAAVLTSYDYRRAITGIAIPELLNASHIIPWSESAERRADPRNGICLNALFDRAFDRALLTLDKELRVVVARRLLDAVASADLGCSISEAHGRALRMPSRLTPDPSALAYHRDVRFVD
jgi:hypothetical protein